MGLLFLCLCLLQGNFLTVQSWNCVNGKSLNNDDNTLSPLPLVEYKEENVGRFNVEFALCFQRRGNDGKEGHIDNRGGATRVLGASLCSFFHPNGGRKWD